MGALKNVRLSQKLVLLLSVSLLGMMYFAGAGIVEKHNAARDMSAYRQLVELVVRASNFIHESQKERGMTSGFLSSNGAKFRQELAEQRSLTDKEAVVLNETLQRIEGKQSDERLKSMLATARHDYFDRLSEHRRTVDGLSLSPAEGVGFYTRMHTVFLDFSTYISSLSKDAALSAPMVSYINFVKAKEYMGIERALGAGAFAAEKFANFGDFTNFVGTSSAQDIYLKTFLAFAPQDQRSFYESTVKGAGVEETARMRQIALKSLDTKSMEGVEAGAWFKAMTEKIDLMKQVEDRFEAALTGRVAEVESTARHSRMIFIFIAVAVFGFAAGIGLLTIRVTVPPLHRAVEVLEHVASGNLTQQLEVDARDEVGHMAAALNQALHSMRSVLQHIGASAQSVATSAEELTSVSHEMSSNSEETSAQANVVSAASEQVSKNVQTVAAGAEQMSASIKEIAKNTNDAARVAKEAVAVAEQTNQTITKLGASSAEIGNVIKVITSIAEQTNLLALNATIEAARAGGAGKGFAVVANEVKELAKQTSEATGEISIKIQAIQGSTQESVEAIGRITQVINQVSDIANTIASAVEEQTVTTNEMARNVEEAAKGSNEIVHNITGVAKAAQSTASGATQTQAAAQELARLASELQAAVSQFKYDQDTLRAKPEEKASDLSRTAHPPANYQPAGIALHAL
jgi:methyl-accepting chemotaxis protein